MSELSVQPEWCRKLPLQQQSVLLLAARGPDGMPKKQPCKAVQVAYRATVLVAAKYGRSLAFGEKADSFMSLDVFADGGQWTHAVNDFLDHYEGLPHHYLMHLLHGVQILGYKHPDEVTRTRWHVFYRDLVTLLHLQPETEEQMDRRLSDWDRKYWTDED
jgi:hypothetical protein